MRNVTIRVEDDRGNAVAYFTSRFAAGQFAPIRSGKHKADLQLRVEESYLKKVVELADEYLNHSSRLDLDWLSGHIKAVYNK